MTRTALLCSEPIRPRMGGIGIRYLELARRLPRAGIEVVLVSPGATEEVPATPPGVDRRRFERGRLPELLEDCDAAVAQGQLANDLLTELPELPAAIDLFDPWLIENLHYAPALGDGPFRNDHACWVLQLSQGDFFLCSSEEQRDFYLGFLTALGRLNPDRVAIDVDLRELIAVVPFGVPAVLPPHRPILPPRSSPAPRLLFGGVYDWYDPWTLLEGVEGLGAEVEVLFVRTPNPESTPGRLLSALEERSRRLPPGGVRFRILDWVPEERRFDLLRDVDALVVTDRPGLESRFSLRTRLLEALAAGCPVVTTGNGTASRLVAERGAGWVVPAGDASALADCLRVVLWDDAERDRRRAAGRAASADYHWDRVIEPLLRFCRSPSRDATREAFACTVVPSRQAEAGGR